LANNPPAPLYIKATRGSRFVDPDFDRRMQEAEKKGQTAIPCHLVSAEPAELQAAHFVKTAALRRGVPIAILWADPYHIGGPAPLRVVEELKRSLETTTGPGCVEIKTKLE
jgi:hypothetical protein